MTNSTEGQASHESLAECGRRHPGLCAWVGRGVDGGFCLQPESPDDEMKR